MVDAEWDILQPRLDPEEAVERGRWIDEPERYERGYVEKGLAEADIVVRPRTRTRYVRQNSTEMYQSVCQWEGGRPQAVHLHAVHLGSARGDRREARIPQDNVRVICNYIGGGFGAKNHPGEYTVHRRRAGQRTGRPVRCALDAQGREPRERGNPPDATVQRLARGREGRDGNARTVLSGDFAMAVGFRGFSRAGRRGR